MDHRMKAPLKKEVKRRAGSPFRLARHSEDIHSTVDGTRRMPTSVVCAISYLLNSDWLSDILKVGGALAGHPRSRSQSRRLSSSRARRHRNRPNERRKWSSSRGSEGEVRGDHQERKHEKGEEQARPGLKTENGPQDIQRAEATIDQRAIPIPVRVPVPQISPCGGGGVQLKHLPPHNRRPAGEHEAR